MVVNIDLMNARNNGAIAPRKPITAVHLSGNALRKHEQIMEYRTKINTLDANLKSALDALATANADIARLNAELDGFRTQNANTESLSEEIKRLRTENARLKKELSSRKSRGGRPAEDADTSSSH